MNAHSRVVAGSLEPALALLLLRRALERILDYEHRVLLQLCFGAQA